MQLNEVYNKDDFKNFLTGFLPDDLSLSEKELVIGNNYKNIKSGLVLGESKSLGVKVFYLEHEKEKDPRVALTTEAFKILSENWTKKALVVFNSKNSENWRLSLMTISFDINEKNKIVSNLSNPKRKSFFLGPNAKIATAKQFLFSKGKVKDFEDLESRFDVEVVTKEFFNNYKKLYTKLLDYLENDKAFNAFSTRHGLELEIFGKKLLGQIVFIYFLQKKGWLGAKKGDNISNGDRTFLRSLFDKCKQNGKNFFNDCLEDLFYSCLNKLPERAGSFYREKFDCQIPFLNGGLFEPINDYKWQNEFINIPDKIFSNNEGGGILDVFDLYNFTIDENTPDDQEISVDPEMLGKVFENLLESSTRKGQGAFYTPREIVHYMCRESLVNYLATNHSNLSEKNIRNYINYGDSLNKGIEELGKNWKGESFTPGQFSELNELLRNIKVVDPACGSGAFLVGMLQEIVRLRTFLQLTPDSELFSSSSNSIKELTIYDLKKETIQNCLYGVDIDPGAIDIAKLRFWLSIVVEENIEDIEPLPNLDYKIMQGNSLLEDLVIGDSVILLKFEGKNKIDGRTKEKKDLFNENHQAKLFIDESEALVEKLEKYHTEYFNITDPDKKKILKKKIDGIEDELIQSKCNEEIERAESFIKNNPNDSSKILKYTEKILAIKEVLRKWKIDHLRPFFPWKLHFGEVFNRENGGFDVVIANPPYNANLSNEERLFFKENFKSVRSGRQDTAAIFVEIAERIGNKHLQFSYILPYRLFSRARNHGEFQKYVINNFSIRDILYLGSKVNFSASDEFMILIMSRNYNSINNRLSFFDKPDIKNISKSPALLVDQKFFIDEGLINLSALKYNQNVLNKIKNDSVILDSICEVRDGIVPYIREKMISLNKKDDRYVKFAGIAGKYELKKYFFKCDDMWLCYDIEEAKKFIKDVKELRKVQLRDRSIFEHRKIITSQNSSILKGSIDNNKIFVSNSIHSTFLKDEFLDDFYLEYILALLNSSLLNYFHNSLRTKGVDLHPQILLGDLKKIPIKKLSKIQQNPFLEIVNKIFEITGLEDYINNSERQAKVKEYEKEIDRMVYGLYGISEEEIKIVES